MRTHVCVLLLMVWAGILAGETMERTEPLPAEEPDLLIAGNEVLADVEELCVVLAAHETKPVEERVDFSALRVEVIAKLAAGGVKHVECKTGLTPRLAVSIEAITVPGDRQYVYRVQTSLNRVVTFSNHRDMHVMAEVWRLRPEMKVVEQAQVADAIADTALTQVEAFTAVRKAAQKLRPRSLETNNAESLVGQTTASQDSENATQAASEACPFVASRSSTVFHRADCRWAQNIAEHNRVEYRTREEAIKDGKRPCKSCRP